MSATLWPFSGCGKQCLVAAYKKTMGVLSPTWDVKGAHPTHVQGHVPHGHVQI